MPSSPFGQSSTDKRDGREGVWARRFEEIAAVGRCSEYEDVPKGTSSHGVRGSKHPRLARGLSGRVGMLHTEKGNCSRMILLALLRREACLRCVVNLTDMRPGGLFPLARCRPVAEPGQPAPPRRSRTATGYRRRRRWWFMPSANVPSADVAWL